MDESISTKDSFQRVRELQSFILSSEANLEQTQGVQWPASRKLYQYISSTSIEDLITVIDSLKKRDGEPRSIALYQIWIQSNEKNSNQSFAAWYNIGVQHSANGDSVQSIKAFQSALSLKPDLYQAAVNLGLAYEKLGQNDAALKVWEDALQPKEARISLLNHKARLSEKMKRYDEAEQALIASLFLEPHQPDAIHHLISIRTKTCSWPIYGNVIPNLANFEMVQSTSALNLLSLFDEISLQSKLNEIYIAKKFPPAHIRFSQGNGYGHKKIRVGYLSSDYCRHPISYLVAELFEHHDRSRFEIYGYCSTHDDGSPERRRVISAFDKFVSIREIDDKSAARAIRADEIDILVDLNGLTFGSRLGVLRWRPAPVQITYLGYNGPVPMPEIDYILADKFVIPPTIADQYRPKPLFLPRCYQVNDSTLPIARSVSRHDAGLPVDKFVYCCFSNNFKITEEIFNAWMEILRQADHSVLWLYADNSISLKNLRSHAAKQGIEPKRLIFADRMEPEIYRARLALADLFLDTYPYNAGTTASDALRVGLPIVTLSGQTYISRMAGSLLQAIGLEEGIIGSLSAYINLAVDLALNKERYDAFRATANPLTWEKTLGDTPRFTRELEDIYASIAISAGNK
jgi:predicted O-linked N-acetylglucosamine transferase (SPINDLY family)